MVFFLKTAADPYSRGEDDHDLAPVATVNHTRRGIRRRLVRECDVLRGSCVASRFTLLNDYQSSLIVHVERVTNLRQAHDHLIWLAWLDRRSTHE